MLSHKRPGMTRAKIVMFMIGGILVLLLAVAAVQTWSFASLMKQGALDTLDSLNFNNKFTANKKSTVQNSGTVNAESTTAPSIGDANAPIKIVEFVDFSCPYTREENLVIREFALSNPSRVWLQIRNFPVDELHPDARAAAIAGACAAEQDKYWNMHDALFANQNEQGSFSAEDLRRLALGVGVDGAKYDACLKNDKVAAAVTADYDAGISLGVTGTPTFFVNGYKIDGAVPAEIWQKIIKLVK